MTAELSEIKNDAREQARFHRDRLEIDQADFENIIDVFFERVNPDEGKIIAAYWPKGKEFDVRFLMDELHTRRFQCALPVIEKNSKILKFRLWTPDCTMAEGAYGIMEPQGTNEVEPDIVLAPLLAFDQKGNRLGQGGGYYDATIVHLGNKKPVPYIGVGYAQQAVLFTLPTEAHDQKLDYVLTPQELIEFISI